MNFSYNWLSELVEGLQIDPAELGRLITMKTAECEGVSTVGAHLERVVAAKVVSVEPIAGSHNVKAVIEAGAYGTRTVVCGAPNCRPGIVTAYVPAGTKLGGREIGKATIDGVESDGMLASGAELGINRDSAGIMELDAEPGAPIPGCRPDSIIEIDNKSLTHRPDLWGHYGMAREVAAILGLRLIDPVKPELVPAGPAPVKVAIEDLDLCPRYSALVFENVTVRPSPPWLQYRLEAIGLNPINNIVDVTNYIMAELAQPMHAFDADLLHGDTIFIRRAPEGAVFVALNEETYTLDSSNLVIADARGPVALAGVIGGLDSAINERTTRIVLESACFSASNIRKTSSKLKLRTDASMRYEKAQDPANTIRGLARAVELFRMVSPGIRIVGGFADQKKEMPAPPPIKLPLDWLARKLGRGVEPATVREILERLAFGVEEPEPGVFSVSVPSWRATKDISIKDDLVEEVGRMIGYDTIEPQAPVMAVVPPPDDEERLFHRSVRSMVAAQGFTEVYNYSFLSEEQAAALGFDPEAHVRVANPIAADQSLMRMSLVPGIFRNIVDNARHLDSFRLFEIGREIHKRAEGLPDEIPHLAAAIYRREDGEQNLFELKRLAECLMRGAEVRPAAPRSFEHPTRAADVLWQGRVVGRLFEFHPSFIEGRAAVLDLDLRLVQELQPREKRYKPIRRFPASSFDLSVIAGMRELAGTLQKLIVESAGPQLESIEFLRQYSGPPIPEGQKSVSFRLTVAAADHTLSLEEVGAVRSAIIERMKALGYELRI
ncbi:MAG TPA: phenylalanine--tRNA ligase subunit beta [Bryobacteraceae bacterium]|nr:phenylalanine--tRNA ligase subunit beta [Bryobacteraceae bacterium]